MNLMRPADEAIELLRTAATAYAAIDNPPGVFPPRELVPLAPVHNVAGDQWL